MTSTHRIFSLFSSLFCIVPVLSHNLVNIQKINPTIRTDIRYATKNNFTNQTIYTRAQCYFVKEVAQALDRIQKELNEQGLGLLIWDGYRPLSAQWKLWNIVPDPHYVSDPRKGGRHTRGTTADLTIINLADNSELEIPTEFDQFTERARCDSQDCSDEAKKNRKLLHDIMEKQCFIPLYP